MTTWEAHSCSCGRNFVSAEALASHEESHEPPIAWEIGEKLEDDDRPPATLIAIARSDDDRIAVFYCPEEPWISICSQTQRGTLGEEEAVEVITDLYSSSPALQWEYRPARAEIEDMMHAFEVAAIVDAGVKAGIFEIERDPQTKHPFVRSVACAAEDGEGRFCVRKPKHHSGRHAFRSMDEYLGERTS